MSGPWNDFNSAQSNANVMPKGTLAKVRLTLRPGGFDLQPAPAQEEPLALADLVTDYSTAHRAHLQDLR